MGREGFFYFYTGRYFGTGPDSDLMMAPDDGSSIMTHPDGKGEKNSVCLAVLLRLQPDCIHLIHLSCHAYTVSRPLLFSFFFSGISQTMGQQLFPSCKVTAGIPGLSRRARPLANQLPFPQKNYARAALKVGQVWHTGVFGEADST